MGQLYALLKNDQLRYVDLDDDIVDSTKAIFLNASEEMMNGDTEEIEFDGRYVIREDENQISYITMVLPDTFHDIPDNQQGITTLDFITENDDIKSIFWYHDGSFLFQIFNSGNLLENKYIVKFLQEQHNFNRFTEKAFIINNKIQAIHKNGRLYFKSFPNVSKIFDLKENMVSATDGEVSTFGNNTNITINLDWLRRHANAKTRRLIKMIIESGTLDTYMGLGRRQRDKLAQSVGVEIIIRDDRIIFPNNIGKINKILEFLNEDVYVGMISSQVFWTNSKKPG